MVALAIAGAAVQAVGLISDFIGAKKQEHAAERAGERAAEAERRTTAERIRQIGIEERTLRGDTLAATAASRVKVDSTSPLLVLAEQTREYGREKQFVREVGATQANAALQHGRDMAKSIRYQAYVDHIRGATGIAAGLVGAFGGVGAGASGAGKTATKGSGEFPNY